jgi:hypothetical protein
MEPAAFTFSPIMGPAGSRKNSGTEISYTASRFRRQCLGCRRENLKSYWVNVDQEKELIYGAEGVYWVQLCQ